MRHYRKTDPDRYLMKRQGIYYYWRRIPSLVAAMDARAPLVRMSLKTDDLAEARAKRDALEAADGDYWQALIHEEDEAQARLRYQAAARRAEALGFPYRTSSELASGPLVDIVRRILALPPIGASPEAEAAVLGGEGRPKDSWWDAYKIYRDVTQKGELAKKSPGQLTRWENTRKSAIRRFLSIVGGDKAIAETTRQDGLVFQKFWLDRVFPDDKTKKTHTANTANKQIGILRNIYSTHFARLQEERKNPFADLALKKEGGGKRMPFAADWIRDRILALGALAGMNDEGRAITLAQVETGCRPGELCNITRDDIFLDDEVPYIHIRARTDPHDTRAIKTEQSDRKIPLVGVSLEVFKRHREGFPRYKDKEDCYSAMANKYLKDNGLRPSRKHTVYSFRHAFEDRMLEGGIDLELRKVLMGHTLERPLYGEKGSLQFRQKVLESIALDFDPAVV
jgi:integrase